MAKLILSDLLGMKPGNDFWLAMAERVVQNARHEGRHKEARWVAVSRVTAHGSGYSIAICRHFGFDPYELV
jgi:hypothetical protein